MHIYTYTISWYKAGKTRVLELNIPFWKLKKKNLLNETNTSAEGHITQMLSTKNVNTYKHSVLVIDICYG